MQYHSPAPRAEALEAPRTTPIPRLGAAETARQQALLRITTPQPGTAPSPQSERRRADRRKA